MGRTFSIKKTCPGFVSACVAAVSSKTVADRVRVTGMLTSRCPASWPSPTAFARSPNGAVPPPLCPPMEIVVSNRQRRVPVKLAWLRKVAEAALEECLLHSDDGKFALKALEEVDVAVVSDAVIAEVHLDFMSIPGATD